MARKKILIIEDNPLLCDLYKAALSKYPIDLFLAHNGEEGFEIANKEKPQIVILDVLMPGQDGIETLKQLKKNAVTKDIKVVMVSVLNDDATKEKAKKAGAAAYLVKSDVPITEIIKKVIEV